MEKLQFVKMLATRLIEIINKNEKIDEARKPILKKLQNGLKHSELTEKEREIYFKNGYSNMQLNELRKQINRVLLEYVKGEK